MKWTGKIIGAMIGLIIAGPFGLLFGLMIGHLFDQGYFNRLFRSFDGTLGGNTTRVQDVFFNSTFIIMGYIAKSDGRVSENEIRAARHIMEQMRLNPAMKRTAIHLFNQGKQANFNPNATIAELKQACRAHPSILQTFIDIQLHIASVDGHFSANKKAALENLWRQLGIRGYNFHQYEQQYESPQQASTPLRDAYAMLGITQSANDSEIKKAYRRQMSKHHPDKLIAKGVPQEMIKMATQRTQQIKKAYESIKAARGL